MNETTKGLMNISEVIFNYHCNFVKKKKKRSYNNQFELIVNFYFQIGFVFLKDVFYVM